MTETYSSAYVTLNEVITQKDFTDATDIPAPTSNATTYINTIDSNIKAQLTRFIYEASDRLADEWQRSFVPFDATITVYASDYAWSQAWLQNSDTGDYIFDCSYINHMDVLSIDSITLDGTALSASAYRLDVQSGYPAYRIIFDSDNVLFPTSNSFSTSIVITGTFGYHNNPSRLWLSSGDTVQNAIEITASGTSLEVSDGTNFEILQYIKIEDEYLLITAISSNTLTVTRGVNGSTASAHANGTAITIYNQTDLVRKEIKRMVIRMFLLRNGFEYVVGGENATEVTEGNYNLNIEKRYWVGSTK